MAYQTTWVNTEVPYKIIDILEEDLFKNFDSEMKESLLYNGVKDEKKRNSKNTWIPASYWIGGFLWHYIMQANRDNFQYDITCIDSNAIQYTRYDEGEYYGWHNDQGISSYQVSNKVYNLSLDCVQNNKDDFLKLQVEQIRKISFVLQLSCHTDYEGGNLQLLDESGKSYFAPRKRGTLICFDSRTQHRVLKVTKGTRKSLVGWVIGPRWR
jgi:PKHD-type hydroxylase